MLGNIDFRKQVVIIFFNWDFIRNSFTLAVFLTSFISPKMKIINPYLCLFWISFSRQNWHKSKWARSSKVRKMVLETLQRENWNEVKSTYSIFCHYK